MIYTYSIDLDIDDDRTYTDGLAALVDVKGLRWSAGMLAPYDNIAASAELRVTLNNKSGRYSLDDTNALYYNKLLTGRLVRVQTTYQGTTVTMTELVIAEIEQSLGERPGETNPEPEVVLICRDHIKQLLGYEYFPVLQQNVRPDEAFTKLHETANVVWPSEKFYIFVDVDSIDGTLNIYNTTEDTDFEQALTTLDWVGDHMARNKRHSAQVFIRDLLRSEVYGLYFFDPRTAIYRFYNRRHAAAQSVTTTFTTEDIVAASPSFGRNPFGRGPLNDLTMSYQPRQQGAVDSVIYSNQNVPFAMAAKSTRVIRGRFADPDNPDSRIGAVDVIQPVRGFDFIGNSESDGSGSDWTKFIIASFVRTATSVEYHFFIRKVGDPVYITTMQARGTPLVVYNEETVNSRDGLSIHSNGHYQESKSLVAVSDGDYAQRVADMYVNTFSTPRMAIDNCTIGVRETNAGAVQTLTIGQRITVSNRDEVHNRDYVVVGEKHLADVENGLHQVGYVLRPLDTTATFLIDTSLIDSLDVIDIG